MTSKIIISYQTTLKAYTHNAYVITKDYANENLECRNFAAWLISNQTFDDLENGVFKYNTSKTKDKILVNFLLKILE